MSSEKIILAFDLYGTLLSTASIAKILSEHFGEDKGPELAATWRKYQLEYTWRLNSMEMYLPFSAVTRNSLIHTLRESSLSLSDSATEDLMRAYDHLNTFPDVSPALEALAKDPAFTCVVFSNGTKSMVSNSVNHSPDLSPHSSLFKDLVVVEEVQKFKPDPSVYAHLAWKMGKEGKHGDMWLISGNPFDAVGARKAGMQAAWVDRAGNGWTDNLLGDEVAQRPTEVIKSLEEVAAKVKAHYKN